MYVNSLACVRVKWGESEWFRIESGVKQGSSTLSWLFNVHMDAVMKEVTVRIGRMGVRFLEGREWRLPGLLYTDYLVLCGEEGLKVMEGVLLGCVREEV